MLGVVISRQTDPTTIGATISGSVWIVRKKPRPGNSFMNNCARR